MVGISYFQSKKALLLNITVNCSATLLNFSWITVGLPMKVTAILSPFAGISQTADLILFGIHSQNRNYF